MNYDKLKEQIIIVAKARSEAQQASEAKIKARVAWEDEHREILQQFVETAFRVGEAEAVLRELTLEAYRETGNKAPIEGVGVREVIKIDYSEQAAFQWAMEHKIALKLDRIAFEKIGKASPLPFVQTRVEPQATISTCLDAFI